MDFICLMAVLVFWAAAVGLAAGCERLASRKVTP